MNVNVQFRSFPATSLLRGFAEQAVRASLEKFEGWRNIDVRMIIGTERARSATHSPIHECEIILHPRGADRPTVVRKTDVNFYRAVHETLLSCEKALRRMAKVRTRKRRRDSQPPASPEAPMNLQRRIR